MNVSNVRGPISRHVRAKDVLTNASSSYFDSDDVAGLLESHFEDLPTGSAADLPLADQVRHLRWIPLRTDKTQTTERDFGS